MTVAGDCVLVAISGGPDSTGLLLVLSELRRRLSIDLAACHVNHRLRGEDSDADEECAAAAARSLDVPFFAVSLQDDLTGGGNLEARARAARYAALHEVAAEQRCAKIATGHTRDDQAETFLIRLVRGAGPRGLSAIHPHREDGVIRPLIDCTRAEVERVVVGAEVRYRLDASNLDRRFLRTRVREDLLPIFAELNPSFVESCARAAELLRGQEEVVRIWTVAAVARLAIGDDLSVSGVRDLPADLRGQVVRQWLKSRLGESASLASVHVTAVVGLVDGDVGGRRVCLPAGWRAYRRGDLLSLLR
jgi:tRNA(Ile)-lysidine synthase